jgi:hypothetical protein
MGPRAVVDERNKERAAPTAPVNGEFKGLVGIDRQNSFRKGFGTAKYHNNAQQY